MIMRSILLRTLLLLAVAWAILTVGGCSRARRFEFTRLCMGVQTRITIHAANMEEAVAAVVPAFDRIEQVEQALSDYRPSSDAMRLCELGDAQPGEWLPVDGDLRAALTVAQRVSRGTDGAFSVAVGPAVALWRASRQTGEIPASTLLAEAVRRSDWRNIQLSETHETVRFAMAGMRLDFGGIGKGYAAQAAIDDLRKRGYSRAMVAIAGDIAVGDPPPGARGWRIRVREGMPDLVLVNAAISTSGDAEQYVEVEGTKYSHIVDAHTGLGFPAPRGVLVSVVARDGAIADALGTALYALPVDRAASVVGAFSAAAILVVGDPDSDPDVVMIDPHGLLRWAE